MRFVPTRRHSPKLAAACAVLALVALGAGAPAFAQDAAEALRNKPHDLSVSSMFMGADIVVKAVMLGLAFASVVTWTVLIAKTIELHFASKGVVGRLKQLEQAKGLNEARLAIGSDRGVVGAFLAGAQRELELSADAGQERLLERVGSLFYEVEKKESRRIRIGTGLLASIGSTAPFVGLFGTVWGIMNSFIGISKAQTTNLAVVAPGIAEALLATAIGLVAAIPAVLIYNHFARQISGYMDRVGAASGEIQRILSRDLDRRGAAAFRSAAQ